MKKKFYFIIALGAALILSGGTYAYTFTNATGTIAVAEPTGNMATVTEAEVQPDWESLLPQEDFDSEILRPDGTGDLRQIASQYPLTGAHWDKVDEESHDGDTTYLHTKAKNDWEKDLYTIPDHSEGEGTILSITVFMVAKAEITPLQTSAIPLIKTNENLYYGTEQTVTADYDMYWHQWDTNPFTDEAWTWEEIDALQIGVALRKAFNNRETMCTQVYVSVNYKFATIDSDVVTGDLFVITPHPNYSGDMLVKVYLTNTGNLVKAYQYLNIKLSLEGADEAFQLLTLENGTATFNLENGAGGTHTLSVTGGSYGLVSLTPSQWSEGWSITPEFYCDVAQR